MYVIRVGGEEVGGGAHISALKTVRETLRLDGQVA